MPLSHHPKCSFIVSDSDVQIKTSKSKSKRTAFCDGISSKSVTVWIRNHNERALSELAAICAARFRDKERFDSRKAI